MLNAAIKRYVVGEAHFHGQGVSLSYSCEAPPTSGLGASGAMNLCWLALVTDELDPLSLAEMVYRIEQARGERGGRQDQYASAVGGINFFEFKGNSVRVESLSSKLSSDALQTLSQRLVLAYSMDKPPSFSKSSQDLDIMTRFMSRDPDLLSALKSIKEIAFAMRTALLEGRLADFAHLLNDEWQYRKLLHPVKTNPQLDTFISRGLQHALGAKPCGSAGGGFVLFYTEDKESFKSAMRNLTIWDVDFDFRGIEIHTNIDARTSS